MLKPLDFDLVYRISCVSSANVLKSDMECSFPVDAVFLLPPVTFFFFLSIHTSVEPKATHENGPPVTKGCT